MKWFTCPSSVWVIFVFPVLQRHVWAAISMTQKGKNMMNPKREEILVFISPVWQDQNLNIIFSQRQLSRGKNGRVGFTNWVISEVVMSFVINQNRSFIFTPSILGFALQGDWKLRFYCQVALKQNWKLDTQVRLRCLYCPCQVGWPVALLALQRH